MSIGLAVALAGTCAFQTPKTADGALAAERYWVAAIERRDAGALDCLLASGFTDFNWRGHVIGRAAMLDGFAAKPRVTLALDDLSVDLDGNLAVVRGRNRQTGPDGTPAGAVRFTDVFVYRDGAWRALRAQETVIRP
ncbi:MAG TPA: nuclear transport factor 2 family protein [Sphingomonas sp.]|nr:nuclear transport factor 2 family protein [Sphingomonas sp.]